jgi:hypothetical protein
MIILCERQLNAEPIIKDKGQSLSLDGIANMFSYTTVLFLLGTYFVLYVLYQQWRRAKLPPGPPRLPIIGNLHQAPQGPAWVTYKKWVEQYGPLVAADFGGTNVIIVGDFETARSLLDKRAQIYSHRPRMVSSDTSWMCDNDTNEFIIGHGIGPDMQE